jgi:hypothetical protein
VEPNHARGSAERTVPGDGKAGLGLVDANLVFGVAYGKFFHNDPRCGGRPGLNGTQRVFLKRLNRLTPCFSKKPRNLEAAFGMLAAYYNFCWQTRKSGAKRGTAAMMAGLSGHVWSFDELFENVLGS